MTSSSGRLVAVTARHVVGPDLDEDVWDRIVMVARHGALWCGRGSSGAALADALRKAVHAGTRELLLVSDGPRLLGFAALRPPREHGAPHVEEIAVSSNAPAGIVMTILLEAAFIVSGRAFSAAEQQPAAA